MAGYHEKASRLGARRNARFAHLRKRVAALAALAIALAVPAFAAPGDWSDFAGLAFTGEELVTPAPMPFERAGENFPGSALYFLEDTPRLAFNVEDLRSVTGALAPKTNLVTAHGPALAAQAFHSIGSALDKARALQCLSLAVYYEAGSESYSGQRAVAQVVLNRVTHPAFPASVCGVVFQGSQRDTGCQFTFTCDGSLARQPSRNGWARAQEVALQALAGQVYAPVGLATHYHADYVDPYWADSLAFVTQIGAHRFYRWKGSAGKAAAFSENYRGQEPLAAPRPRTRVAEAASGQVEARAEAQMVNTAAHAPAAAAPANDRLPQGGQVRAEFAKSGNWIKQPD